MQRLLLGLHVLCGYIRIFSGTLYTGMSLLRYIAKVFRILLFAIRELLEALLSKSRSGLRNNFAVGWGTISWSPRSVSAYSQAIVLGETPMSQYGTITIVLVRYLPRIWWMYIDKGFASVRC